MVGTYRELLREFAKKLSDAGIDNTEFDCRELLAKAAQRETSELVMLLDENVETHIGDDFITFCERRLSGEPLQYILGEWEFYGLKFKVGEGVLIPRQDTETIVDCVINKYKNLDNLTLVDLCSGTGCIAVALEKHLNFSEVYAVERSAKAADHLKENVRMNASDINVIVGDILDSSLIEALPKSDIITCNPPYLTDEDMKNLQREVTFEPAEALYGGEDGLDFYRDVTRLWKDKLKSGGMIFFEIGAGQEDEVMQMMIQHGFENVRCKSDLCGVIRCVMGTKKRT